MELKRERVLELFLGLVFVALLAMIVILVLYLPGQKQTAVQTSNTIQNSYNTNSYNTQVVPVATNSVISGNFIRNYDYDFSYKEEKFLRYSSYGQHTKERTYFNNYRDEFKVYVVNKDYEGGYFKVKFNFCDYYDNCFSETVEKYIRAKEEVKFVYLDVQSERYKYDSWEYQVFPEERF